MTRVRILGILNIILGAILAFIPSHIAPVCQKVVVLISGKERPMKCFFTGQAEFGVGLLILFAGIILLIVNREAVAKGISMTLAMAGAFAIALAYKLIGMCMTPIMDCRVHTEPAIYLVGGIIIVVNLIFAYILDKQKKID